MGRAAQRELEQLTAELEEARRRIAELEAEEAAAALSSGLVQHLFDGFALLDPKGVHLDVNPALCAMTGFSREELVGVGPPHPYWPPEDHAAMREELTRDLAGHTRDQRRSPSCARTASVSPSWWRTRRSATSAAPSPP